MTDWTVQGTRGCITGTRIKNRCTEHPLYGSIGLEENSLRQSHLGWRLMELVPVLDHNKLFVTDKNGVKRRANKFEISRREEQLFHQRVWLLLEKSVEELASGGRFVHCGDDVVRNFVQVLEITELVNMVQVVAPRNNHRSKGKQRPGTIAPFNVLDIRHPAVAGQVLHCPVSKSRVSDSMQLL